jgi:hypothetical protein
MFIDTHDLRGNEASFKIIEHRADKRSQLHLRWLESRPCLIQKSLSTTLSLGRSCRIRAAILDLGPHFAVRLLGDQLVFRRILVVNTSW